MRRGDGLWAVEVSEEPSRLRIGPPRLLFRPEGFANAFDITRDGRHFVMVQEELTPPARQFQIVVNPLAAPGTP